jgi:hypothetical protein
MPAAGAGNLETTTSRDEYRFTTTTSQSLYLDMHSCPTLMNWRLLTEAGTTITSGTCTIGVGDVRTSILAAGIYNLVVTPYDSYTGTYRIDV